jgi:hypothetical protein
MSHQISREDFQDFTAATMLASAGTKRLWVVASVLTEKVYYVICDRRRGDTLEVNSGSNIVYSFDEAIALYNSIG